MSSSREVSTANIMDPRVASKVTEVMILKCLYREHGRVVDIAKESDLNQKTIWQALQRLGGRNFVAKDKFNIYEITSAGKDELDKSQLDEKLRKSELLARLALKAEFIPEGPLKELLEKAERKTPTQTSLPK